MPETLTLYHNPRCGKSRAALALLQESGADVAVVEYLKTPLTRAELAALVSKLGIAPEALVRKGEDVCKEHYTGRPMTDDDWLDALATHPILMERPVAVMGGRAVIGRPPENVLGLL